MTQDGLVIGRTRDGRVVRRNLGAMTTVGSAHGDLILDVSGVSPTHARFVRDGDGYVVEDASSRDGTSLNGEPITRARLHHLDVVTLGSHVDLVFLRPLRDKPHDVIEAVVSLQWLSGPFEGQTTALPSGESILGRGEQSSIVLNVPAVSRSHARLTVEGGAVTIEDLDSANGTFVSGRHLRSVTLLHHGDEVDLAHAARVRLSIVAPREVPKPQTAESGAPSDDTGRRETASNPSEAARTRVKHPNENVAVTRVKLEGLEPSETVLGSPLPSRAPDFDPASTVRSLPRDLVVGFREVGASSRRRKPLKAVMLTGALGTFTLPLGRSTIGRGEHATLRVNDPQVSRIHVAIVATPDGAIAEDQGSANGSKINGTAFTGSRPLAQGDRLGLGSLEFVVDLLTEDGSRT